MATIGLRLLARQTSSAVALSPSAYPVVRQFVAHKSSKAQKARRRAARLQDPYEEPPPASEFPPYEGRDFFRYELIHQSKKPGSRARVGRIHTPHGIIDTPGYVPVATNGVLKCIELPEGDAAGMQLMFCNTYHLMIHPGPETIANGGGLHKFIGRDRPIITDSGGFQVFSMAHGAVHDEINMKARRKRDNTDGAVRTSEVGATFRSYRTGESLVLTPESSVLAQKSYGADIIIPLDELPPYHIEPEALRRSVYLSHRWMARSLKTHLEDVRQQAMYGVVHGGVDPELRQLSIDYLSSLPFDGFAIGGSLGKDRDELIQLLEYVMPRLPQDRPNHLLGIADPKSIWRAAPLGVDTFDSCYPTRLGRHGTMLSKAGDIHLVRGKFKEAHTVDHPAVAPIAEAEGGFRDGEIGGKGGPTFAYVHHLFKQHEPTASKIVALHNLRWMLRMMAEIRQDILEDRM